MRIARRESNNWVDHYGLDHLGNARIVYGNNGVSDQSDFYPFGGENAIGSQVGNRYKFTGKERDAESGLDNFGARYDSSQYGRFTTPDPSGLFYADPTNPQSLNLYSYVGNNPLNYVDLDGLLSCGAQDTASLAGIVRESFLCRFANFFGNLFSGGGNGSDNSDQGGSSSTGMSQQQLLSRSEILKRIQNTENNLGNSCDSAYNGVGQNIGIPYSRKAFADSLRGEPIDQEPNAQNNNAPAADASTGPGRSGPGNHRIISLWHDFYSANTPNYQGFILWHEGTHAYFGLTDTPANASKGGRDFITQFSPFGYSYRTYGGGTDQFTKWLQGGCHQ